MQISSNFLNLGTRPDLTQTLKSVSETTGKDLNCMRIGIIQDFYPDDLTVQVLIANKKDLGQNQDGSSRVQDFAPIRAKVCYCNPFETFPLKQGDECLLLFSDREIESWFINGNVNQVNYPRMHSLTDAVAIVGLRSLPNMIKLLTECLHLFFYGSELQLGAGETILNSPITTLTSSSEITLNAPVVNITGNLNVQTGYSGIVPCGSATLAVTNGIITGVS